MNAQSISPHPVDVRQNRCETRRGLSCAKPCPGLPIRGGEGRLRKRVERYLCLKVNRYMERLYHCNPYSTRCGARGRTP